MDRPDPKAYVTPEEVSEYLKDTGAAYRQAPLASRRAAMKLARKLIDEKYTFRR